MRSRRTGLSHPRNEACQSQGGNSSQRAHRLPGGAPAFAMSARASGPHSGSETTFRFGNVMSSHDLLLSGTEAPLPLYSRNRDAEPATFPRSRAPPDLGLHKPSPDFGMPESGFPVAAATPARRSSTPRAYGSMRRAGRRPVLSLRTQKELLPDGRPRRCASLKPPPARFVVLLPARDRPSLINWQIVTIHPITAPFPDVTARHAVRMGSLRSFRRSMDRVSVVP